MTSITSYENDIVTFTQETTTSNGTDSYWCNYYKKFLIFSNTELIRVIFTFTFFLLSAAGNTFVLYCLYSLKRRTHVHIISLHLTLADLMFTFFVIPIDGAWNITMSWDGGECLCRLCQMLKQFGMYINSLMIVVTALDRAFSILMPMTSTSEQAYRTRILLIGAWVLSFCSAFPAVLAFTTVELETCPGNPLFVQCIDAPLAKHQTLYKVYYMFTTCMSFALPFLVTIVSYCLILYEISMMQKRDLALMGRRDSASTLSRARRKTFFLTSLVSATFVCLWGPYCALGFITWFLTPDCEEEIPAVVRTIVYILLYVHPSIHPLIFGVFIGEIRKKFKLLCGFGLCHKFCESGERRAMEQRRKIGSTSCNSRTFSANATKQKTNKKWFRYLRQGSEPFVTETTALPVEREPTVASNRV